MSQAGSQAWAFYRQVAETRTVWTVRDEGGFPQPLTIDGGRAQPFWSSRTRVERIIETVPAHAASDPVEIPWAEFRDRWVPGLTEDGVRVGVNWSGPRAVGYDLEPAEVQRAVESIIEGHGK